MTRWIQVNQSVNPKRHMRMLSNPKLKASPQKRLRYLRWHRQDARSQEEMLVTMLAMDLLLVALVGDMVGAFNPARLILHSRPTGLARGAPHAETCPRCGVQVHNLSFLVWLLPAVFWWLFPPV